MTDQGIEKKTAGIEETNEMKKQALEFLQSRYFYAASDLYEKILDNNPNDKDAHIGLLLCRLKVTDEGKLIEYYQNLYSDVEYEIKLACDREEDHIEEMCEKHYVPDYYEKEEIRKAYDCDLTYKSNVFSRKKQREQIRKTISENKDLAWLKDKGFKEIADILGAYDRRLDEAEKNDRENVEKIRNDYQRFLYQTFSEIKDSSRKAKENKDRDYQDLIREFEKCSKIDRLRELSLEFEKFKGYRNADGFVDLCYRKIEDIKADQQKESEKRAIDNIIDQAKAALVTERFSDAYDNFTKAASLNPNNEEAYLGILMARTKTSDVDELFDYYKNLYSDEVMITLEACEEDSEHIDEMVEKYFIPEYLDKETIREKYAYDRTYRSCLEARRRQENQFKEEIESDPVFEWLKKNGSDKIKKQLEDLRDTYSRRIKEAEEEDRKHSEQIRNDYQRFLFKTYASIKKLHKQANGRKEEAYRNLIRSFELADDESKLKGLISDFEELGSYKEAEKYRTLCLKKIDELKEKERNDNTTQEVETTLIAAKAYLSSGNRDLADQTLSKVLSMDPDNPKAYLGILMIETGTKNLNKLINYYKNLYQDDEIRKLDACDERRDHIEKIVERYHIPGYLEKETIRKYYSFDRSYDSITASRIEQKEQFNDEVKMNPLLVKIAAGRGKDEDIDLFFDRIYEAYDERIEESKIADEKQIASVRHIYDIYLEESDKTVYKIYEEKLKEKDSDREALYQKNIEQFEKELNEEELEDLSKRFDPEYKDGQNYAYQCLDRIRQLHISKEKGNLEALLQDGTRLLESKLYFSAADKFNSYLQIDPDDEEVRLKLLMAEKEVADLDSLFAYYKDLYSDEVLTVKEAVREKTEHIDEMCEKCCIPGFLEKEEIRKHYEFDRTYEALAATRQLQKQQIEDEISLDPSLSWLNENGSSKTKAYLRDLLDVYDQRAREAEEEDRYLIESRTKEYRAFIKSTDREVRSLFNELNRKRNQDLKNAEKLKREEKDKRIHEEAKKQQDLKAEALKKEKEAEEKQKQKDRLEKEASILAEKERKKEEKRRKAEEARLAKEEARKQKEAFGKDKPVFKPNFSLIAAGFSLILLAVVVYIYVLAPSSKYNKAIDLAERGEYDEAIAVFRELENYKDSQFRVKETTYQKADYLYKHSELVEAANIFNNLRFDDSEDRLKQIKEEMIRDAKVGDIVLFGDYEQDGNTENGKEMIEWIVLDKAEGGILVISKYGVEAKEFNTSSGEVYWENSSLRSWLNGRFPDNSFSRERPSDVLQTTLINQKYPEADEETDVEELVFEEYETRDKVFLLSSTELEQYFPEEDFRKCAATEYAIESGVAASADNSCSWWLRSPGNGREMAEYVWNQYGTVASSPQQIIQAIRPAMWIKTE